MITPSYGPTSGHAPATDRDGRRPRRDADADRDAERFRQLLAPPAPSPSLTAPPTMRRLRTRQGIARRAAASCRRSRAPRPCRCPRRGCSCGQPAVRSPD
ncbi:hypothetical protein O0544_01875 [Edwardsiella anguillarum]|nr:hypothetical protein [Edwardsiella anguillarum]